VALGASVFGCITLSKGIKESKSSFSTGSLAKTIASIVDGYYLNRHKVYTRSKTVFCIADGSDANTIITITILWHSWRVAIARKHEHREKHFTGVSGETVMSTRSRPGRRGPRYYSA
jgi:hypothetical protein